MTSVQIKKEIQKILSSTLTKRLKKILSEDKNLLDLLSKIQSKAVLINA